LDAESGEEVAMDAETYAFDGYDRADVYAEEMAERVADVTVENHGSLLLFRLNTDEAREWVDEYVADDAQYFGGALVVEPRYASNLANGMADDGLEVR
jgi:hypothetical protein